MKIIALLVLETLAAYRIWRLLAVDTLPLLKRPRDWLIDKIGEDSSVAELILCPWCLGAYVTIGVVAMFTRYVSVPLPYAQALAVSTLVGLLAQWDDA